MYQSGEEEGKKKKTPNRVSSESSSTIQMVWMFFRSNKMKEVEMEVEEREVWKIHCTVPLSLKQHGRDSLIFFASCFLKYIKMMESCSE